MAERRKTDSATLNARSAAWWKLNGKEWTLKNKDHLAENRRAYYRANPEKFAAKRAIENAKPSTRIYKREWARKNAQKSKAYYLKNRDKKIAQACAWQAEHKQSRKAYLKKYVSENQVAHNLRSSTRRALKRAATINLNGILKWMGLVKSRPSFKCYYCDFEFPISSLHFDHIVALKCGGLHSVENLCTACVGCNLSKKAKSISAWVRIGQQTLPL